MTFMEGFTIVLLTGWLLLLAAFAGMYRLDQITRQTAERRASQASTTQGNR
jgi:hypothetical protein